MRLGYATVHLVRIQPRFSFRNSFSRLASIVLSVSLLVLNAHASIISTGNVSPSISSWTSTTDTYVGKTASGTVTVNAGSNLSSRWTYLGYNAGVTGTLSIDSATSNWSTSFLDIGESGIGNLNITNGATVTSAREINLGYNVGAIGNVTLNGANSTLNCQSGLDIGGAGKGILTASNNSTINLSPQSFGVEIGSGPGSSGILNLSNSSQLLFTNSRFGLTVGNYGTGTINLTNGSQIASPTQDLYVGLGYQSGAIGSINISGSASSLSYFILSVGIYGTGNLNITNGATVSNYSVRYSVFSLGAGASGNLLVDGPDSTLRHFGNAYFGDAGTANILISNGGKVDFPTGTSYFSNGGTSYTTILNGGCFNANQVYSGYEGYAFTQVIGSGSTYNCANLQLGNTSAKFKLANGGQLNTTNLTNNIGSTLLLQIDNGTALNVSGTLTNNGIIYVVAGPLVPAGQICSPITAGTWAGNRNVTPVGGTWDNSTHTFKASPITQATAGQALTFANANAPRILFNNPRDPAHDLFMACCFTVTGTITATPDTDSQLVQIQSQLPLGTNILCGWDFTQKGIADANFSSTLASIRIGPGFNSNQLQIWTICDGAWVAIYDPRDIVYDGNYVQALLTFLKPIIITQTVPEPASSLLLSFGIFALVARRRRMT